MRISFLVVMVISELNARFRLRFAELLKFLILIIIRTEDLLSKMPVTKKGGKSK